MSPRPYHTIKHTLSRPAEYHRYLRYLLLLLLLNTSHGFSAEHLRVGIYQNPPKVFLNNNGQASGFFSEILQEIARREHWRLEFVPCHWEACLTMLEQAEIDLLPDMAFSPKRAARFDFNSEIVLYNWSTLYRRSGVAIHAFDDLDDKRVAVLRGSIQYEVLKTLIPAISPNFIEVDDPAELLSLAADGKVDAVLLNRLFAQQQRRHIGLRPTHLIIEHSHLHYAATAGKHPDILASIDEHLRRMKQDHRSNYYRAMARWVEQAEPRLIPEWFLWLLQGMLLLLLILLSTTFILRGMVQRRTAELKNSHAQVTRSEKMFHSLFTNAADAILLYNGKSFVDCNRAALRVFGYSDKHHFFALDRDDLFPPMQTDGEPSGVLADQHIETARIKGYHRFPWLHRRASGEIFTSEVTLVPVHQNGDVMLQVTIRDTSQLDLKQRELDNLTRALQTLSQVNHALIHAQSEPLLLQDICRVIVEHGGYKLAWIGYARYDDARSLHPVAQLGFHQDYLESLNLHWQNDAQGQHPGALAIREAREVVVIDILNQPEYSMLHEEARHYGYASCIALPLQRDAEAFGVLVIYSEHPIDFAHDEVVLLRQLANDLAFGIRTHRLLADKGDIVKERRHNQQQVHQAMQQTIQAFVVMLELRDPYTSGHQRRSAELAVAIAQEMALDADRIEGIRFGAMLHDIGNIQVPAEILIRPGRLSEAELALMRNHTQAGYEILRDVHFPWPVAQMILTHHERMDGSGYPKGLRGEQIPLEARIIAVADVVEAMLSHRPYRPALGVEAAMAELWGQRGRAYDEAVVDACIRLFEEKNFSLTR